MLSDNIWDDATVKRQPNVIRLLRSISSEHYNCTPLPPIDCDLISDRSAVCFICHVAYLRGWMSSVPHHSSFTAFISLHPLFFHFSLIFFLFFFSCDFFSLRVPLPSLLQGATFLTGKAWTLPPSCCLSPPWPLKIACESCNQYHSILIFIHYCITVPCTHHRFS